jgi:hypothetical protein
MTGWMIALVLAVAASCAVAAGRVRDERRRDILLVVAAGIGVKLAVLIDLAHAHLLMQVVEVALFLGGLFLLFQLSRRRA